LALAFHHYLHSSLMTTDTATKIHYSPLAECRWAHLVEPRAQMDDSKPPAWSVDLVLTEGYATTTAFQQLLDEAYAEHHGRKKRSPHAIPLKPDKQDPGLLIAKFKAQQLVKKDGTTLPGPKVIDSQKGAWNGAAIGNGSKIIIAYRIHAWERPEGCGVSLIPKAVQVVHFVPYVVDDGADGFDVQPDGYKVPGFADEFEDEFA
jgi:hypothetical protein